MELKAVMEHMGSTNARLREIFTSVEVEKNKPLKGEPEDWRKIPKAERDEKRKYWKGERKRLERDYDTRMFFENQIRADLEEGVSNNFSNYRLYQTVDLAMDSTPINKETVPLMMYAQGKIDFKNCVSQLQQCGCPDTVFQREDPSRPASKIVSIDIPRFVDFSMNVVKSTVRRRVAAQTNKFLNMWPFLKVDPRGSDQVTRVRADALSALMDIITDSYGHREHQEQVIRYGMMYGRCMDFKRSAWEKETHPRFVGDTKELESKVTKQGFGMTNPHPTRWAYDSAYPPSSINSDSGCRWLFHWDVCRYSEILDEPGYFNVDKISVTKYPWDIYYANLPYFNYYLDRVVVPPSITGALTNGQFHIGNDRQLRFGFYTTDDRNSSVFKAEYFRKIVPSRHGIGKYSGPVWVRFTATLDGTVIGAEFVYSRPAAYLGIDEDDNRQISPSMAMELLHFQDAMTNLVTQMLLLAQLETLTIIGVNVDAFPDTQDGKAMVDKIRRRIGGQDWSGAPHVIEYSLEKIRALFGDDATARQAIIDIKQASVSTSIQTVFNAMVQLLSLMDRMLTMSPAETGQPAPREISATEVMMINNSTSTVYDAISNNVDTYRAALKVMMYESAVNCWKGDYILPLRGRYPDSVIEKAGLKIETQDDIVVNNMRRATVTGYPAALLPEYSYAFTSRDGAERTSDVKAAAAMAQTLQFIVQVPQVLEGIGKEKLYEIVNEIFRMAGATISLNLEVGDDNGFQEQQMAELKDIVGKLQQALQQVFEILQETDQKMANQEALNNEQQQALSLVQRLADQVAMIQQNQESEKQNGRNTPPPPRIDYKTAPDSVKSQMEILNGLSPATSDERRMAEMTFKEGSTLPPPK